MRNQVILVDKEGQEIGTMEKMQAHIEGVLHRAFSVFLFNDNGEILLQQRAAHKYHSAQEWTNACCSHPQPGEDTKQSAADRLMEEMGIETELSLLFETTYHLPVAGDLIEHEFDYVYLGIFNGQPIPNPEEVMDWKWVALEEVERDIQANPQRFTPWFKFLLPELKKQVIFKLS